MINLNFNFSFIQNTVNCSRSDIIKINNSIKKFSLTCLLLSYGTDLNSYIGLNNGVRIRDLIIDDFSSNSNIFNDFERFENSLNFYLLNYFYNWYSFLEKLENLVRDISNSFGLNFKKTNNFYFNTKLTDEGKMYEYYTKIFFEKIIEINLLKYILDQIKMNKIYCYDNDFKESLDDYLFDRENMFSNFFDDTKIYINENEFIFHTSEDNSIFDEINKKIMSDILEKESEINLKNIKIKNQGKK